MFQFYVDGEISRLCKTHSKDNPNKLISVLTLCLCKNIENFGKHIQKPTNKHHQCRAWPEVDALRRCPLRRTATPTVNNTLFPLLPTLSLHPWFLTLLEVLNPTRSIHAFIEPFVVAKIKCVS